MANAGPFKNCAVMLPEKISGASPAMVVMEVRTIGLNLERAVSAMASLKAFPSFKRSFNVEMKTSALFTKTPIRAIVPISEKTLNAVLWIQCPAITPMIANGKRLNTKNPWENELQLITIKARIKIKTMGPTVEIAPISLKDILFWPSTE